MQVVTKTNQIFTFEGVLPIYDSSIYGGNTIFESSNIDEYACTDYNEKNGTDYKYNDLDFDFQSYEATLFPIIASIFMKKLQEVTGAVVEATPINVGKAYVEVKYKLDACNYEKLLQYATVKNEFAAEHLIVDSDYMPKELLPNLLDYICEKEGIDWLWLWEEVVWKDFDPCNYVITPNINEAEEE